MKFADEPSALQKLINVEIEAREFGFEWSDTEMILAQAVSECNEISQSIINREPDERIQEEIGDLLHVAISLCIFAGFNIEDTLLKTTVKFDKRISTLKQITENHGLISLHGQSVSFMLQLWQQAKMSV